MTGRVLAVGSVNADQTAGGSAGPSRRDDPGYRPQRRAGGKSANQAVAAARLGAGTTFVGAVGDDHHGELVLTALRDAGVEVDRVRVITGEATGQASICVDDTGENSIVVLPGVNDRLEVDQLTPTVFAGVGVLMLCFEVAEKIVLAAAERAEQCGVRVITNPSPIRPIRPGWRH